MNTEHVFTAIGGEFYTKIDELQRKVGDIRGFIYDWDGVFNTKKDVDFSEPDAMGLNMLRYGFWRASGEIPFMAIISGDHSMNLEFPVREHFNAVYRGFRDKCGALDDIGILPCELAYFYDDINDLSAAKLCGLKIQIRRVASPLLSLHVREEGLCDYVTGCSAKDNALREASEMILGIKGIYSETIKARVSFYENYKKYLSKRGRIKTEVYSWDGARICKQ